MSETQKRKHGEYNHYSAEQRYKIAKYAVENSFMKASKHFSTVMGKQINKIGIRAMKKSYILKRATSGCEELIDGLQCDKGLHHNVKNSLTDFSVKKGLHQNVKNSLTDISVTNVVD